MADVSSGRRYGVDPRTLLVTFLDTLPSREAEIARLRYGIGRPSFTEEQLAIMFEVSKEKIAESLANVQRWLNRVDLMWVAESFERQTAIQQSL